MNWLSCMYHKDILTQVESMQTTNSVISEITDLALVLCVLQDVVSENGTVEVSDGHEDVHCSSHHILILIHLTEKHNTY